MLTDLRSEDCRRIRTLMQKYRDQPMDLADAALVCLAERENISRIFTFDHKHFNIYRAKGMGRFNFIP